MRERGKIHTHHIDLNPGNNTPANIIKIDSGVHGNLHDEIYYLFDEWGLGNRKSEYYRYFIKYFLKSGELVFDRTIPEYRFNLVKGGCLEEYYNSLKSTGKNPPLSANLKDRVKNIRIMWAAFEKLTLSVLEGSG